MEIFHEPFRILEEVNQSFLIDWKFSLVHVFIPQAPCPVHFSQEFLVGLLVLWCHGEENDVQHQAVGQVFFGLQQLRFRHARGEESLLHESLCRHFSSDHAQQKHIFIHSTVQECPCSMKK